MKGFRFFMKEFAKTLMVLESNIKAIRPITAALTCLLIELRLNGPINNTSVMFGLLQETGRDLKGPIPSKVKQTFKNPLWNQNASNDFGPLFVALELWVLPSFFSFSNYDHKYHIQQMHPRPQPNPSGIFRMKLVA